MEYDIARMVSAMWDVVVATIQRAAPLLNNQQDPLPSWWVRRSRVAAPDAQPAKNDKKRREDDDKMSIMDVIHTPASDLYTPTLMTCRRATMGTYDYEEINNWNFEVPFNQVDEAVSFYMAEFNPNAWNMVVLGLATSPDFTTGAVLPILPFLRDRMTVHGEIIRAIQIAGPMQLLTQDIGAGAAFYQQASLNVQFSDLRDAIMACFITATAPRIIVPAKASMMLGRIHGSIYGTRIASMAVAPQAGAECVNVYGRWSYAPMAAVWIDKRYQGDPQGTRPHLAAKISPLFTPSILPDLWLQLFAQKLPKGAMAFPVPFGLNGPAGYHSGLIAERFASGEVTPRMNPESMRYTFATDCLPELTDESKWNVRLMAATHIGALRWRFGEGMIPNDSYMVGRFPCVIKSCEGPFQTYSEPWIYLSCTTDLPFLWDNGLRVYPVDSIAHMQNYTRAEVRQTRLAIPTWVVGSPTVNNPTFSDDSGRVSRYAQVFRRAASSVAPADPADTPAAPAPVAPHLAEQMVNPNQAVNMAAGVPNPDPVVQQ